VNRATALSVLAGVVLAAPCSAQTIELGAVQTGGFYGGGVAPDNKPEFQNYFVGYGTSPGKPRTGERRSFFHFDLSTAGPGIESAALKLRLPFGGLIFGKGPGDPALGPVPSDPTEAFAVGVTSFSSAMVTSSGLTGAEADAIFDSFDAAPVAAARLFGVGGPPIPPDLDGKGAEIVIPLSAAGIAALNAKAGGDIVLTGWMPSWSLDTRLSPLDPSEFFEASELIFGLTDVHKGVPKPILELRYAAAAVPEPASAALLLAGLPLLARLRRRPRDEA